MSTRQNKKRKSRSNVLNRERTVTTLTEGPESTFLIPTPTEEPAPAASIMPPPFSSSNQPPNMASNFSPFGPFPNYHPNYIPGPMSGSPFQQSPQFFPQAQGPPGKSDLELLERLKEMIKNNQHELFRPVPQPAALASLYLGPRNASANGSHVPPHPEQIPGQQYTPNGGDVASSAPGENGGGAAAAPVGDARRLRPHVSESWTSSSKATGRSEGGAADVATNNGPSNASGGAQGYDSAVSSKDAAMDVDASGPPGLSAHPSLSSAGQRSPGEIPRRGDYSPDKSAVGDSVEVKREELPGTPRLREREPAWRNSRDEYSKPSFGDRNGNASRTYNDGNRGRWTDRDNKDRDFRDRDRDRDWERDRERDRGSGRDFDRDRRPDDRPRYSDNRRPPPEQRHYEPRYNTGLSRYDTKSSAAGDAPPPASGARRDESRERDRSRPPLDRVPRPEDRPFTSSRPPLDDRDRRPLPPDDRRPPPVDDRRGPAPIDRDRDRRPIDDRRAPPPASDRRADPPVDDRDRRPTTGPLSSSTYATDRQVRPPPADDRRSGVPPPPARISRPSSPALSTTSREARMGDDRRPPPVSRDIDRTRSGPAPPSSARGPPPPSASDDRRPAAVADRDRPARPGPPDDRRAPIAEDRSANARPPPSVSTTSAVAPPAIESPTRASARAPPPAVVDERDRATRAPVPLEDRISSRAPTLQERLGGRPEPGAPPAARDERVPPRPTGPNAEPLSTATSVVKEERAMSRPPPDTSRPPPVTEPKRDPAPSRPSDLAPASGDDRGRPLTSDRFSSSRGGYSSSRPPPGPPPPRGSNTTTASYTRAPSVARDDRSFKPRSPSPRKGDYNRPGYRPPPADYDRRSDAAMDVDAPPPPPPARFSGNDRAPPASYRRASPPPYTRPAERSYADLYPPPESTRRHDLDSHASSYPSRDWREDQRGYNDDWDRRGGWDRDRERDREFDRDPRYLDRDPPPPVSGPPAWDSRDDRDRRSSYPSADSTVPPRPYESRPLSARLSDGYPPADDRDRERDRTYGRDFDRRYPAAAADTDPAPFTSRVRPRSPSPAPSSLRRPVDDIRPPIKRVRDEAYPSGYYSPTAASPLDPPPPSDYAHGPPPTSSRLRNSPPPPSSSYYDDRPGYGSSGGGAPPPRERDRERDFVDTRDTYASYDRAVDSRMPPPPPPRRSPPPYGRASYGRDDRRGYIPRP
ncbi:hypothetical protein K474DRAFT_1663752 [Panus rudis PR-1116 ss-1]|nr:hypothetical protein K474DRAFT_1663752 [Panus rudis PR-1116 ss-1]